MNANQTYAYRRILLVLLIFTVSQQEGWCQDNNLQASRRGGSWHWTPDEWTSEEDFVDIHGYAKPPAEQVLDRLTVQWQQPTLDKLGNICTVRGQLVVSEAGKDSSRPVNWFQGISVYLAKSPDAKPDWSKGMDQKDTLSETTTVSPKGEFSLRFDIRKAHRERTKKQPYQFGIALAKHSNPGRSRQKVVWNSRSPVLPATLSMLKVPAAESLSRELELINEASGWPFSNPNGVKLIRAANALQQVGQKRALAVLEEYAGLTSSLDYFEERNIVFWIIRVLFEPIRMDDRIPHPGIYVALLNGDDPGYDNWPLIPMAVIDDVPFMVGQQIGGSGRPEHPSTHIEWARRNGVIRDQPIKPTLDPISAAESLINSQRFKQLNGITLRKPAYNLIRSQSMAMVTGSMEMFDPCSDEEFEQQWKILLDAAENGRIRWDADREEFVIDKD